MLRSYLTIAFRFMARQTGFTVISIFGLTVGIACSLLILIYIQDELSYDNFHKDASRTYRLGFQGKLQGRQVRSAQTGSPVANAIRQEPFVESATRLASWATFPLSYQGLAFTEKYLLLADSNFFQFFSFELVAGHPDSVLRGPHKIVISESAAKRFFDYQGKGDTRPLGKTITLAQGYQARVTGIAKDAPANSHFHYTLVLSLDSWPEIASTGWIAGKVITYFRLTSSSRLEEAKEKFQALLEKNADLELKQISQTDLKQFKSQGNEIGFIVQPLRDIHLTSHLSDEIETNGNIQYIYLFAAIAFFILVLASINFMNLSTARSASRSKEVGMRKVVGAHNLVIVRQFLMESYLYILVAVGFALLLALIFLTPFSYLTGKRLDFHIFYNPGFLLMALGLCLLLGLLAGSYPAFYLTRFSPIDVLKGTRARLRSYGIRNLLVIFQFFISASLIIATLVVYRQLSFLQRMDVGFSKHNILNLLHTKNLGAQGEAFKKELLTHPEIVSASYSNRLPPNIEWQAVFRPVGMPKDFLLAVYEMDYDHLTTMGYTMKAGRFFSRDVPGDSLAVILNETAARKFGWTGIEGKKVFTNYDAEGRERNVIGIMKDFNSQSLKNPIQPVAIILGYQPNWEMAIRLADGDREKQLALVKDIWTRYVPNAPFEYTFLDSNFAAKQATEKKLGVLFILFTALAIIIACLGLFGLATFTADQRTKEIGIRKVLGATAVEIGTLLNYDFLKLVLIANVLAWPLMGWLMTLWLNQFAFHIGFSVWPFLLSGLITTLIALGSVSYHTLKASHANPVRSLRTE